MKNSGFVVIICLLLLQGNVAEEMTILEQCNGYCFSVLQPYIDHLLQCQEAADHNNGTKDKIQTKETIGNLQSQLLNSGTEIKNKDEQITDLREHIKGKDEQITDLREQITDLREHIKGKDEQITDLREHIKGKDEQIKGKDEQINGKVEQIKVKDEQIKGKDEQIKVKDEQIKDLRAEIKGKDEKIKVMDEQITGRDKQIKDKDEQILLAKRRDQPSQTNPTAENLPDTCARGCPNGIFQIKVKGMDPFQVPCDSSGWMVIQRRIDGSVDFNRNWKAYKEGFGDMRGEFFIGLQKLHLMTAAQPQELYIQLRDVNGTYRHASYDNFIVGSEEENFILKSLGEYSGNAGDSLRAHEGAMFTTLDRDNKVKCVRKLSGPWWFKDVTCGKR
ncbi:fibrinogen-like protein 1 [Drosophila obscura]|uniref:fibrinogen-like protein 1 n=1 Tax=Drosophila obscura TaxID=7282 RepID=UPI001BB22495|nr:fibrinogen-like protein 1 [Drosophila obscura]